LIEKLSQVEWPSVRNTAVKARLNTIEKKKMTMEVPKGYHVI
jgi:hypothetical protein